MRHRVAGKQLSRTTSHRKALRRNMAAALIANGAIRTTEPKAKELRRFVEKLITVAKKGTLHARRRVIAQLGDKPMVTDDGEPTGQTVVQKLFGELAGRYADRPGGYTRIIRLDERRIGDAGPQVILQLVEEAGTGTSEQGKRTTRRKARAAKRHEAAAEVEEQQTEPAAPDEEAQADRETGESEDDGEPDEAAGQRDDEAGDGNEEQEK